MNGAPISLASFLLFATTAVRPCTQLQRYLGVPALDKDTSFNRLGMVGLFGLLILPVPLYADARTETIWQCGKPTNQEIRKADGAGILYYRSTQLKLAYQISNGEWHYQSASDSSKGASGLSYTALVERMPCITDVARKSAPPSDTVSPATATPASGSDSPSWLSMLVVLGIGVVAVGSVEGKRRAALLEKAKEPVKCPNCGSTQVQALQRGWTLIKGFVGSGSARIICLRCGKSFKPGRGA